MNGASIRFSRMRGSGGAGGVDAWRDMLSKTQYGTSSASTSAKRTRTTGTELPKLNTIHQATVVSIQPFGAFMQLGEGQEYKDGLLHLSAMGKERVESVHDAGLELDMKIWVKVSEVKEMDGKYGLDMRYVSQRDGTDLDPYHTKGVVPDNFFEGKNKRLAAAAAAAAAKAEEAAAQAEEAEAKASAVKRKKAPTESSSDSDSGDGTNLKVEKMPPKLRKKYEKTREKLLAIRKEATDLGLRPGKESKEVKKEKEKEKEKGKEKDKKEKDKKEKEKKEKDKKESKAKGAEASKKAKEKAESDGSSSS